MSVSDLQDVSFDELLGAYPKLVVQFWATWSEPCAQYLGVYEDISNEYPDVTFVRIEISEAVELSQQLGVDSVPTLIGFREGLMVFERPGAPNHKALRKLIDPISNGVFSDLLVGTEDGKRKRRFGLF
ncbi:MAG: thioredoxin family protein [Acidimicrobiales bacterium]